MLPQDVRVSDRRKRTMLHARKRCTHESAARTKALLARKRCTKAMQCQDSDLAPVYFHGLGSCSGLQQMRPIWLTHRLHQNTCNIACIDFAVCHIVNLLRMVTSKDVGDGACFEHVVPSLAGKTTTHITSAARTQVSQIGASFAVLQVFSRGRRRQF
jgi:hypothetical protein